MRRNKLLLATTLATTLLVGVSSTSAMDLTATLELLTERIDYLEQRLKDSDLDNDGFSPAQGDCDDSSAAINPASTTAEIGGDGIDNNCDGQFDNVALSSDVDNDGLTDWDECAVYLTDPSKADTDGDSLPEAGKWENYQCNCKQVCTKTLAWLGTCAAYSSVCSTCQRWVVTAPAIDMGDGIEVTKYGTNPTLKDTDSDQINDGTEIRNNTNPLNAGSK